jgi:Fe-S-cluster containining protein
VVLEEIIGLSRYFPVVITVEVDEEGKEERFLCAYFRLKEDSRGCVYLKDGMGCLLGEEKPYTCKQYPLFIKGNYLAMDLTCPGFSQEKGEPLWDGQHINQRFERQFFAYSLRLQEQRRETEDFVNTLFELNLVVGGKMVYEGLEVTFNMVDEERLYNLPEAVKEELFKSGYMRLIYAHLNSLQNWERLIKKYLSG